VVRIDRAWAAALDRDPVGSIRMNREVNAMTTDELYRVEMAAHYLKVAVSRRLRMIEQEKIRTRIQRYGHAEGLRFRDRPHE
jgi:hypothetical protein